MTRAIRWMGDDTSDPDVWDLTHRYDRGRVTIVGSPTTLYFTMPDRTPIIVPRGWWICDDGGEPYVSSADPRSARAVLGADAGLREAGHAIRDVWLSARTNDDVPKGCYLVDSEPMLRAHEVMRRALASPGDDATAAKETER